MVLCLMTFAVHVFTYYAIVNSNPTLDSSPGIFANKKDKNVAMECKYFDDDDSSASKVTIRWYKNGDEVRDELKTKFSIHIKSDQSKRKTSQLYVTNQAKMEKDRFNKEDVGEIYSCKVFLDNDLLNETKVTLFATPQVEILEKPYRFYSTKLFDGDRLRLTCTAWGWPLPDVLWTRLDGVDITAFQSNSSQTYNFRTVFLTVNNATFPNRGNYTCEGRNWVNDSLLVNNSYLQVMKVAILVRVQARNSPLWPFIGIIVEVVILVFILMWNKLKKKEEARKDAANLSKVGPSSTHYVAAKQSVRLKEQ